MKSEYFLRYRFIIEKLQRSKYADYNEINDYLFYKFNLIGIDFNYSLRTFQRDKIDIENIFNIEIKYNRFEKAYFINETDIPETAQKLLDAYTVTNALQLYEDFSKFISFEKDNLGLPGIFYEINEAIKNKQKLKVYYQKYYEDTTDEIVLKPLALKEFRRRWYLIAYRKDKKTGKDLTRTYGLDRIAGTKILTEKFQNIDFDLNNYFKDFYGIITDQNTPFEEVILQFDSFQGNYVKSLPLHHSQEILQDTEDALIIKIRLHITFDFIQKLLSFGKFMKVLQPEGLKQKIKEELEEALGQY